jgi:hypothetical protein
VIYNCKYFNKTLCFAIEILSPVMEHVVQEWLVQGSNMESATEIELNRKVLKSMHRENEQRYLA